MLALQVKYSMCGRLLLHGCIVLCACIRAYILMPCVYVCVFVCVCVCDDIHLKGYHRRSNMLTQECCGTGGRHNSRGLWDIH